MLDPIQTMKNFEAAGDYAAGDYIAQLKRELAEARANYEAMEKQWTHAVEQCRLRTVARHREAAETEALRAELERVMGLIESAPHEHECNSTHEQYTDVLMKRHWVRRVTPLPHLCNCWKRAAASPRNRTMDNGRTHWEGCWTERGHEACAGAKVDSLELELAVAREEIARLKEARSKAADFIDRTVKSHDALRAELARLTALIERAPHQLTCASLKMFFGDEVGECDCWKRAARQPEQPQSEDDKALTALVDEFAAEMKLKLLAKRREGNWGWDNPENRDKIEHGLFAHLKRPGQWIDVANYAAFLWNIDRQPEQGDPI